MDEKLPPPKALPRLRVTSHSFSDVSNGNIANVTQRTVSSSTSMMSTPSNNIRRVQQQTGFRQRPKNTELRRPDIPAGGNATRKLLNLQRLKKTYLSPKPFVLRKPLNMTKYDYSVFANHPAYEAIDDGDLPPPIKQSQIRAWESAEKVSANIIFERSNDSTSDNFEVYQDGPRDEDISVDDDSQVEDPEVSINRGGFPQDRQGSRDLILSIPGYSKNELQIYKDHFDALNNLTHYVDGLVDATRLLEVLQDNTQQEANLQDRELMSQHTITGKRKAQLLQKKELYRKMFGASNNVNQDFVTNNTSYSAFDNTANVQKVCHEDSEEIHNLYDEDKWLAEYVREHLDGLALGHVKISDLRPWPDRSREISLLEYATRLLTARYSMENEFHENPFTHDSVEEIEEMAKAMMPNTIAYLKRIVKEAE